MNSNVQRDEYHKPIKSIEIKNLSTEQNDEIPINIICIFTKIYHKQ